MVMQLIYKRISQFQLCSHKKGETDWAFIHRIANQFGFTVLLYKGSPYRTTQGKSNETHAEACAAKYILEFMGINTSVVPVSQLRGKLKGYRQATTDYACDGCDQMQQDLGITNVTGTRQREGKGRRTQRLYDIIS